MSKLREIEAALLAVDSATFHRLADAYLHRNGYSEINAIGLVLGADKNAIGTPDTFVPRADGTYVFFEHSTQELGLPKSF